MKTSAQSPTFAATIPVSAAFRAARAEYLRAKEIEVTRAIDEAKRAGMPNIEAFRGVGIRNFGDADSVLVIYWYDDSAKTQ